MAVITISRQFGAGGRTLGKMIAGELGYTFADSEIIQMIAEKAKVSPHWVENAEQQVGKSLSRVVSSLVTRVVDWVLQNEQEDMDEAAYLDYLVVIIAQLAEEGNVVILGRGSQYILHDHPDAVHILLVNDLENRIRYIMKQHDLTHRQAAMLVNEEDRRRISLYRTLGKADYDDPSIYHLSLHTGRLTMKESLGKVLRLVRQPL